MLNALAKHSLARSTALAIIAMSMLARSASADDPIEAARQRILNDAASAAVEASRKQPPLTDRAFIRWWRRSITTLGTQLCRCHPGDRACARLAYDEFHVDMIGHMMRLPAMVAALAGSADTEDARKAGQNAAEELLRKHVRPKEQLRIQARLERCTKRALATP